MQIHLDVLMLTQKKGGFVYVIFGPMFSGKTGELFRNLRRVEISEALKGTSKIIVLFKPKKDGRYSDTEAVTHNGEIREAIVVKTIQDMKDWIAKNPVDIIAIDEGQFFNIHELNTFASSQADQGKIVVVATLDQDFRTMPFEGLPELLVDADFTQQLHPVCVGCGGLASRSRRTIPVVSTFHVGGKEAYEPLCRACYNEREMEDFQSHATED